MASSASRAPLPAASVVMPTPSLRDAAPRIVLDTNVCLDLFVFHDPQVAPLHTALQTGRLHAVTREDCRAEWLGVLSYPQLALDAAQQQQAAQAFDACVRCLPVAELEQGPAVRLPRCSDLDDQKFLELAAAAQAGALLTRDRALLQLARRTAAWFAIMTPQTWCASQ